jgi:hypothetical protein
MASLERDPSNELLSAFPRRRLDAEAMRDTLLLLDGHDTVATFTRTQR